MPNMVTVVHMEISASHLCECVQHHRAWQVRWEAQAGVWGPQWAVHQALPAQEAMGPHSWEVMAPHIQMGPHRGDPIP